MKIKWNRMAAVYVIFLIVGTGMLLGRMKVCAASFPDEVEIPAVSENTFVAIGADITEEQLDMILPALHMNRDEFSQANVIYITNAEEHAALDTYVDPTLVGSKSISCARIDRGEPGSGITVETLNITYCTADMYRNALVTAGISDAVMIAASPVSGSGTAALLGAMKAYVSSDGEQVSADAQDAAVEELVLTSDIAQTSGDSKLASDLVNYVKACFIFDKGKNSEEEKGVRSDEIIKSAQEKFGITLTEDQSKRLSETMDKIGSINIDTSGLVDQTEELYKKYGETLITEEMQAIIDEKKQEIEEAIKQKGEELKEAAKEKADEIKDSAIEETEEKVAGFWKRVTDSIKEFFTSLFK